MTEFRKMKIKYMDISRKTFSFKVLFITAAAILFLSVTGYAQNNNAGTSAANFLKIGVGARPMAMGDAAIATVSSPEAMYWNVAALARMSNSFGATISTMDWLVDTRNSYIAAALNLQEIGIVGVDFTYLNYGKIEETTVYNQHGTGRYYSADDMEIGLGYARNLTDRFAFGFKVKYISENIADANADAFGFDVGALFRTTFFNNNLRLAAAISNFGTTMQFTGSNLNVTYSVPDNPSNKEIPATLSTIKWDIPLLFRFGISNYFINSNDWSLLVAYDILDSRDFIARHNVGMEVGFEHLIYIRGGYKFNYSEASYTAGIGLDFSKILNKNLTLDYSYIDYGVFNGLNQFTLNVDL